MMRFKAFGIINLVRDAHKLGDNMFVSLPIFYDELVTAFETDKVFLHFEEILRLNCVK